LELPRFSLPVAGTLRSRTAGHLPGLTPELNKALREAFTPTRPKQEVNSLFVGRLNTLRRIIAAIEEERAHVVLFGDRGRGKTSLANAIQQIASQAGYFTLKLTCSAELSFEDVFRNFLRRIPGTFYRSEVDNPFAARRTMQSFDELLPNGSFSVTELNDVLAEIQGAHVLLVLDEYDRVTSEDLRNKLAELIKNLTDSSIPATLFIVGVAENLDQLIGKHPSIQRSLVAVHLPLMSDKEIDRIIVAGSESAGVGFSDEVRDLIVMLAKGLPYYAQLLALHAARSAVSRGATHVGNNDLAYAVARCVQEAERSIVEAYNKALGPDRKASFADVMYVAAQCRSDDYGSFHPGDMAQVPVRVDGEPLPLLSLQYPLSRLSDDDRGGVLQRIVEPGGFRYRFRNQMMRQYVLMRQAKERGLI
jgi:Cdc6-like AAA superfamily ATPase